MDIRQIQQFLAVAESLSFRKAADRLHMSQPPLSMAIRRLEASLGAPLFQRGRRGVTLTAVGAAVLDDARRVAFHTQQLRQAAAAASTGDGGTLRIAFVGSATYTLLPRALPRFRERHPGVALELKEGTTSRILRDVEAGQVDVGLVRYPVVESTRAELAAVEHDVLAAVVQADSALARRRRVALADLAQQPFVMYSASEAANLRGFVMLACQRAGFTPRIVQEAVQVQTLISLVESGIGVALVPSRAQRCAPDGVAFRRLTHDAPSLAVSIAVATRGATAPRPAMKFVELLAAPATGDAGRSPRV